MHITKMVRSGVKKTDRPKTLGVYFLYNYYYNLGTYILYVQQKEKISNIDFSRIPIPSLLKSNLLSRKEKISVPPDGTCQQNRFLINT